MKRIRSNKRIYRELERKINVKGTLPKAKDQYTITEIFPSKLIMENALKNAL